MRVTSPSASGWSRSSAPAKNASILRSKGGEAALFDIDFASQTVTYNDRAATMLGYAPGELPNQLVHWETRIHPDDRARALAEFQGLVEGNAEFIRTEHRQRTKSGGWIWVGAMGKVVERDADGRPRRLVGIRIDITERKNTQMVIEHMALHDPLTGLPNRAYFNNELQRACANAQRQGHKLALLLLDLDHFKEVNDSLGHTVGDQLLIEIAKRLRSCARKSDLVVRLGGDEFAIIAIEHEDGGFAKLADRIIDAIAAPASIHGVTLHNKVSIGVTIYPDDGGDIGRLLINADAALYSAKMEGRHTWRPFDNRLHEMALARRSLEHELARAIECEEFELQYQPVIDTKTLDIRAFEALIRWNHPQRGQLSPDLFIPAAERSHLIVPLTEWVLQEALRQRMEWLQADLGGFAVSVNVSTVVLKVDDFVDMVERCFGATGCDPRCLTIEITEGFLAEEERAVPALDALRGFGVTVAVDDFGTGYSSMSRLKSLPVDLLKIDRSFVSNIPDEANDTAFAEAIIRLGRSLGLQVIAEGVATDRQLQFLAGIGCQQAQGFLIARALAAAAVPTWVQRWQAETKRAAI